jgi:hypothetical protein
VWRVFGSLWVAVATDACLALNPAQLGPWGSRVTREVIYGSLCMILIAGTVLRVAAGSAEAGVRIVTQRNQAAYGVAEVSD